MSRASSADKQVGVVPQDITVREPAVVSRGRMEAQMVELVPPYSSPASTLPIQPWWAVSFLEALALTRTTIAAAVVATATLEERVVERTASQVVVDPDLLARIASIVLCSLELARWHEEPAIRSIEVCAEISFSYSMSWSVCWRCLG